MKIGGYQIIDLKGKNLTVDVGMVYEGIYDLIEGTNKAILISGLVVGGVEYDDTIVECSVVGNNFECILHGYKLTIRDNDVVTVSTASQGSLVKSFEVKTPSNSAVTSTVEGGTYYIAYSDKGGCEAFMQGEKGHRENTRFIIDITSVTTDGKGSNLSISKLDTSVNKVTVLAIK